MTRIFAQPITTFLQMVEVEGNEFPHCQASVKYFQFIPLHFLDFWQDLMISIHFYKNSLQNTQLWFFFFAVDRAMTISYRKLWFLIMIT